MTFSQKFILSPQIWDHDYIFLESFFQFSYHHLKFFWVIIPKVRWPILTSSPVSFLLSLNNCFKLLVLFFQICIFINEFKLLSLRSITSQLCALHLFFHNISQSVLENFYVLVQLVLVYSKFLVLIKKLIILFSSVLNWENIRHVHPYSIWIWKWLLRWFLMSVLTLALFAIFFSIKLTFLLLFLNDFINVSIHACRFGLCRESCGSMTF